MAQQIIGIGAAPDDGTGDTLRVGGDKINDNFTELYDGSGLPHASAAEYRTGSDAQKVLDPDKVWDAAAFVALTDAATVAMDLATGINFSLTIGGNRTLGNPTNAKEGQSGCIQVTQDGTGSRTLAYSANHRFAGGTDIVLSTAAGAIDLLFYQILPGGLMFLSAQKAIAN